RRSTCGKSRPDDRAGVEGPRGVLAARRQKEKLMRPIEHMILGNQHLAAGRPAQALTQYVQAIQKGLEDASSYYKLGLAYQALGKNGHAHVALKEAVKRLTS